MDYTVQDPAGNEHVITGPEGASDEEILQAAQSLLSPNAMESFGRAAVNNLPLGGQIGGAGTAALKGEDYSQGMKEFNDAAINAKAAHPIAYGAGATAGSLAPLAVPGVGEALEAAPVATSAALGAANAVGNTDIAQNPGEAAKQAVLGGVTGAGIGAILPGASKAQEGLENYANRKTVESMGLPPGLLNMPKEDLEKFGSNLHELGLDTGSMDDKVNTAASKLQEVGNKIGAMGKGIPPLQDATPFIDELHQKIQESGDIFGAGANPEAPLYRAGIDKLSQPGLTFEELQKMKTAIGQRAFNAMGDVKNDAAANLYGVYKDAMKSIVKSSPEEYQGLMDQYGDLLDVNQALGKMRGNLNAGGFPGKPIGMLGKLGSMVTGGNVPATAGLAAAAMPFHPYVGAMLGASIAGNPGAMSTAARGVGEALPEITGAMKLGSNNAVTSYLLNTLNQNPQKLGRFAQPLINAAKTGGSQGLAAQHFLLSSQYPEYNSLMMKQENPNESQ